MSKPTIDTYLQYMTRLDLMLLILGAAVVLIFVVVPKRRLVLPLRLPPISDRVFLPVILVLAAALRLTLMNASLWYDEAFAAQMASLSLGNLSTAIMGDVHPAGFYLLQWGVTRLLGDSAFVLRLPSLVAGIALVWLMHRLTRSLTKDRAVAQLATILTAVLPAMIYYSTEARYPALLACLIIASIITLNENKPRLFLFAAGFLAYFHALGLAFAVVLAILAFMRARGDRLWALMGGVVALTNGMQIPVFLLQSKDVSNGFWLLSSVPFWHVIDMTVTRAAPSIPAAVVTWSTSIALSLFGIWQSRHWFFKQPALVLLTALPVAIWVIGLVWNPLYLTRTLIAPALLLVVAWAYFLIRSPLRRVHSVLSAALVVTLAISGVELYTEDRSVVDNMLTACAGADVVYATSTNMAIMLQAQTTIPVAVWDNSDNLHQQLSKSAKLAMGFDFEEVSRLAGDVCVVYQLSYYTTDEELTLLNSIRWQYIPSQQEYVDSELFTYGVLRFTV